MKRLERSLSPVERASCARVHCPRARRDAIAARALLRSVLSRYLGLDPAVLDFRLGPQGKPSLSGAGALQFNLSHSDGLALCAVASGRRVGVDLERIRPDVAVEQISERYFSAREASVIRLLPDAVKRRAFFRCWTQKEAYLKATGKGIASSLDGFSVSAAPGEPAGLLDVDRDPLEASRWELAELTPGPGYVGALAVEGHGWRLACWDASTTLTP